MALVLKINLRKRNLELQSPAENKKRNRRGNLQSFQKLEQLLHDYDDAIVNDISIATHISEDEICMSIENSSSLYNSLWQANLHAKNLVATSVDLQEKLEQQRDLMQQRELVESFEAYSDLCDVQANVRSILLQMYSAIQCEYKDLSYRGLTKEAEEYKAETMKRLKFLNSYFCLNMRPLTIIFTRLIGK